MPITNRSDPTSPKRFPHNPSPPAGGAAFQNNSFSFIILSLRADAITATLCRADVVFDTQSFFMGGPDVLLCQSARVPECQAHQHDCQAYQECYSVRPSSSALLLVFLCQAQPAVVLLVIHSQAPPNLPTIPPPDLLCPRSRRVTQTEQVDLMMGGACLYCSMMIGACSFQPVSASCSLPIYTPAAPPCRPGFAQLSPLDLLIYIDPLLCSREVSRPPRGIKWSSSSWMPNM